MTKIIKTENIPNLLKWEGFSSELPWMLFIFFLLFASYGWFADIKQCRTMMNNNCYQDCRLQELIRDFELENPGVKVNCYIDNSSKTYKCDFAGVQGENPMQQQIQDAWKRINNISLVPDEKEKV